MIVIEDGVDNKGTLCTVAYDSDGPIYRTSNGLTECRAFLGFTELVGYGDGYVTWVPVFTEWWEGES